MHDTADPTGRVNFRIASGKKQLIERAAAARGMTLTQFAVSTLVNEAREVLQSEQVLTLGDRDRDQFLAALDHPPAPHSKLRKAAKAYQSAKAHGRLRSA